MKTFAVACAAVLVVSSVAVAQTANVSPAKPVVDDESDVGNLAIPFRTGVFIGPSGKPRKVKYQVINGRARFEGDIDLGPVDAQGNLLPRHAPSSKAVGVTRIEDVWPNCVVPWRFDPSVPTDIQNLFRSAIFVWESDTPCTFPIRSTEKDFVTVVTNDDDPPTSHSDIGRVGGEQHISIYKGATNLYRAVHEIGHTLGLFHEHTRHDRDNFITINTAAIRPGCENDFEIDPTSQDIGLYDFDSVMHYGPAYCGNPKGTTTITSPLAGASFGQRDHLSTGDIAGALEIQGMWQGWDFFTPLAAPKVASAEVIGAGDQAYYYDSLMSGGRDFGRLCRHHYPWWSGTADCIKTVPSEPLTGLPAVTPSLGGAIREASIFVRGADTGSYLFFRRDYATDAAGGAFRMAAAPAGTGWLSSPAAIKFLQRVCVFGIRRKAQDPSQTVIGMVSNSGGTTAWSAPVELPQLVTGLDPSLEPAVISTRSEIWTLFAFDRAGALWVIEGQPDGTIVTGWTRILPFIAGAVPQSGPTVIATGVPGYDLLVLAAGKDGHLTYAGLTLTFTPISSWRDIGGLLGSRPSAVALGAQVYVLADIQTSHHWLRIWRP